MELSSEYLIYDKVSEYSASYNENTTDIGKLRNLIHDLYIYEKLELEDIKTNLKLYFEVNNCSITNEIIDETLESFNNYITNPNIIYINLNNLLNIITNQIEQEQEQEDVPIVLKEEELTKLEKIIYKDLSDELKSENKCCPISLEDYKDEDELRHLPCKHLFLCSNIDNWLLNNSHKCPVCRESAGESIAKV